MNFATISALPHSILPDDPEGGVLRPWVRKLPLRYQGVLVTAIRGCDIASKEDHSKRLVAMIRRATLNQADSRERLAAGGFFGFAPDKLENALREFLHSLDQYPLHYIAHLAHACEVIAYESPEYEGGMAEFFRSVYYSICRKLHMNAETPEQLRNRLTEDRVAAGTVERDF